MSQQIKDEILKILQQHTTMLGDDTVLSGEYFDQIVEDIVKVTSKENTITDDQIQEHVDKLETVWIFGGKKVFIRGMKEMLTLLKQP